MNIHDRIALELGRALMRACAAEGQLEAEHTKTAALEKQLLGDKPKTKPRGGRR